MRAGFVVAVLLCLFSPIASLHAGGPHTSVEAFQIPKGDIPKLEAQALLGSGDAAYRLSQFYAFVAIDSKEADFWLNVAAQDDNSTAQYGLGLHLSDSSNERDHLRACYWLGRSKQKGSKDVSALADSVLARLSVTCKSNGSAP